MSSNRIKQLLETLDMYNQSEITHVISINSMDSLTISYDKATNSYQIFHSNNNIVEHHENMDSAIFAIAQAIEKEEETQL